MFVLESTCEVIGQAEITPGTPAIARSSDLRVDWAAYIESKLNAPRQASDVDNTRLLDNLHWPNHEEYSKGISKLWLKRTENEGTSGIVKRIVAQRYVLACVISNRQDLFGGDTLLRGQCSDLFYSISGSFRTANEMAQEFNGRPALVLPRDSKAKKVNLVLPAYATRFILSYFQIELTSAFRLRHHHVESVHFATSSGRSLHPALAVVQTPAREYYILRDNGMQVGCEEEGVAEVWREVIGCKADGSV